MSKDVEDQGPMIQSVARVEHEANVLLGIMDHGIGLASLAEVRQISFQFGLSLPLILKKEFLRALCSLPGAGKEWLCLTSTHSLCYSGLLSLISRKIFRVASFYGSMYIIRWSFLFLFRWIE